MRTTKLRKTSYFLSQGVLQLLFPAVCISCGRAIRQTDNQLCRDCWQQLLSSTGADYCRKCGKDVTKYAIVDGSCPDCLGQKIHFDEIARSGIYTQSLRSMILAFKTGRTELDSVLAFLADAALQASGFCNEIDFFVPVPLHWRRRLTRGYNQSLVLARKLKHPSAEINTDLVRIRHTKAQPLTASPQMRARNVKNAFTIRYGHKFKAKNICLVDDIKTTGATLNECAKTLKETASAAKVFALVLAVAGQNVD